MRRANAFGLSLLLPALSLLSAVSHADVLLDWDTQFEDFHTTGLGFTSDWTPSVSGGQATIVGNAYGLVGRNLNPSGGGLDWTRFAGDGAFALDSRLNPGHDLAYGFEIGMAVAGTTREYYYRIPAGALSTATISNFRTADLGTPDYVLSGPNGAILGSGSAFAPDLSHVLSVWIQGEGLDRSHPVNVTFDRLQVVPEPASFAVLGIGVFAMRRRRPKL